MLRTGSVKTCPGVCVAERIADYCEAVINVAEMCKPGLKCCVTRDSFSNAEKPANFIIMDHNTTRSPQTTAITTVSSSTTYITTARSPTNVKNCQGECVNGLLALFCDDVDTTAFCPGEDSCCINNPVPSSHSGPSTPPLSHNHHTSPRTPSTFSTSATYTTTMSSYATQSTSTLPRCPGFCLLNIMMAFCERPAVLIPNTSTCKKGSVCCDNTRVTSHKTRPHTTTTTTTTTTMAAPPDPRPECPGSCIMPYLSFTCFSKYT